MYFLLVAEKGHIWTIFDSSLFKSFLCHLVLMQRTAEPNTLPNTFISATTATEVGSPPTFRSGINNCKAEETKSNEGENRKNRAGRKQQLKRRRSTSSFFEVLRDLGRIGTGREQRSHRPFIRR